MLGSLITSLNLAFASWLFSFAAFISVAFFKFLSWPGARLVLLTCSFSAAKVTDLSPPVSRKWKLTLVGSWVSYSCPGVSHFPLEFSPMITSSASPQGHSRDDQIGGGSKKPEHRCVKDAQLSTMSPTTEPALRLVVTSAVIAQLVTWGLAWVAPFEACCLFPFTRPDMDMVLGMEMDVDVVMDVIISMDVVIVWG